MSTYQFELAFRQYIAAFDGTNDLSPAEFKTLFDNVHHKDFKYRLMDEKIIGDDGTIHLKAKEPVTREEKFASISKKYASGRFKATMIYFRKIGMDCIDTKFHIVNGEEEKIHRVVHTISDGQAILSQEILPGLPPVRPCIGCKPATPIYSRRSKYANAA